MVRYTTFYRATFQGRQNGALGAFEPATVHFGIEGTFADHAKTATILNETAICTAIDEGWEIGPGILSVFIDTKENEK